jgi:hypothetical protein
MNAKKQRERERKELETLGRKHLANVRVVQRNVAYVTGLGPRFAKEEVRPLGSVRRAQSPDMFVFPAHPHTAIQRLLRAIRQNLEDHHQEVDPTRKHYACCRAVHHVSPA